MVRNPDLNDYWWQKYMNRERGETMPVKIIATHWTDIRQPWDYTEEEPEPHVCQHFTCRRVLTPREQLFGNYCIDHSITH
jgi:hypothetical protein